MSKGRGLGNEKLYGGLLISTGQMKINQASKQASAREGKGKERGPHLISTGQMKIKGFRSIPECSITICNTVRI